MTDFVSSLTRAIAQQYDLFQTSLVLLQKDRKFLNYGYTVSGKEPYEERQERLCLEVFQAAEIGKGDVRAVHVHRRALTCFPCRHMPIGSVVTTNAQFLKKSRCCPSLAKWSGCLGPGFRDCRSCRL